MIRNSALFILQSYFSLIVWLKCLLAKCLGGEIIVGQGASIHPSVVLSTHGGKIVIGENCAILKGAIIAAYGGNITLGNNVSINPYSILYGQGGLTIGNDVRIAAHSMIVPAEHIFDDKNELIRIQGLSSEGIAIGNDVWISAGAKILDGAQIKDGCVIGANAVLKGETEPHSVYVGVPAKKIKERK